MSASTCAFCRHANPAGAKYCNECASPLELKPCRACEAVNAKTATACHRCHAAFAAEPPPTDVSTETLVAQADETLEELRRELAQATSRAPSAVRDPALATQAPAHEAPPVSEAPPASVDLVATQAPEVALPRGDHFISLDGAPPESPPVDAAAQSPRYAPDEVVLRARRGSPVLAVAAIIFLLALPLGVYAWRNPEQLQSWIAQLAAMFPRADVEAPAVEAPATETPAVAAPAVPAPPVEPSATTSSPSEPAVSTTSGEPRTLEAANGAPSAVPAQSGAPGPPAEAAPESAAAAAAAAPAAKSATAQRPRASTSKSRPRERTQRQRSPSPSSASGRRAVPPNDSPPEPLQ